MPYSQALLQEQLAVAGAGDLEGMREALDSRARALIAELVALAAPASEHSGALATPKNLASCALSRLLRLDAEGHHSGCLRGDLYGKVFCGHPGQVPRYHPFVQAILCVVYADPVDRLQLQLQDLAARERTLMIQLQSLPGAA